MINLKFYFIIKKLIGNLTKKGKKTKAIAILQEFLILIITGEQAHSLQLYQLPTECNTVRERCLLY